MGTKEITNISAIRPVSSNLNIGNSTTMPVSSFGTINIGDFTTSTGDSSVNIGLQNIARSNSVAIGKETIAGTSATVIELELILLLLDMITFHLVVTVPIFLVLIKLIIKLILYYSETVHIQILELVVQCVISAQVVYPLKIFIQILGYVVL